MEYRICDRFQKTQNDAEVCMFSSVPRIARLLAATSLALASLATAAHAQTGAQGRPDATNVQMVSVPETYCRSIDNTDMTGQDYYFSAADVTAKSGKVIQSHNGGSCCTAAAPWNGSACQAVPTCTNDKDLIGWSCVATADSCARVGMTLINGACGVASPPSCVSSTQGKVTTPLMSTAYKVNSLTTIAYLVYGSCIEQSCSISSSTNYPINQANCSFTFNGNTAYIQPGGLWIPSSAYMWSWSN